MFFKKKKKSKKRTTATLARKLITVENPKAIVSEQFRTLRTNINFSNPDKVLKTILVTSSSPGEGKSTTSANVASVYAQEGKRVLLVDGDMRKPTVHHTFGLKNTKGLSNVLTRQVSIEEAIQPSTLDNLSIMTSGPIPPNPAELLASKSMEQLIGELTAQYDFVIFDAPPILSVTDSQILSNRCDGTVLVVKAGEAEKAMVQKAKESLVASQANILGVVLNNFVLAKDNYYYYQYYGQAESN
ncbi:CpsD/CapB family tyrosine-protein kinase [Caryophanon latum]|uniref:non-specific protein-tyrosine kinase n=1 Tax=Caryophanon latum TaxID=33977 RepID=A0A1C0YM54_9BACL|nr:CpsD/CapB family tyrosine-protein kinase [Caryophanon latum]OCS88262.1 capsular biosynthesis protein [Caryophanon latum]